jgi:hypothetical protein
MSKHKQQQLARPVVGRMARQLAAIRHLIQDQLMDSGTMRQIQLTPAQKTALRDHPSASFPLGAALILHHARVGLITQARWYVSAIVNREEAFKVHQLGHVPYKRLPETFPGDAGRSQGYAF